MKCLCFSDSHGTSRLIREALNKHCDAETVFFLGDGLYDLFDIISDYSNVAFYYVRGNCDASPVFSHIEKTVIITLEGKKILLTHGDAFGVKGSLGQLICYAKREECDLALFGHTHLPLERYDSGSGTYLFNPGSISDRYDGRSYGIITIKGGDLLLSHGSIDY